MSDSPRVYVLSTVQNGLNTLRSIYQQMPIQGVIGLSKREESDAISGYVYAKPYCDEIGLPFIPVDDYTLQSSSDKEKITQHHIDCLLVLGWQRLVPEWLIEHASHRVIGVHGSASGITGGRGRSPQNWALILGKNEFHVSIFFIDPGIDSGDIIDSRTFSLSPFDTIKTSHNKVSLATADMLISNWDNNNIKQKKAQPQSGEVRYLPKRTPEDGAIDWSRSSTELHNFIRGQSQPYPGCHTTLDGTKVILWKAHPFECSTGKQPHVPGTIVKMFINGDIVVSTSDSFLYIEEYEIHIKDKNCELKEGMVFESTNFKNQMTAIINRHQKQYPGLVLSNDILDTVK